jgi:Carboxypeptidase regulatory-like domain
MMTGCRVAAIRLCAAAFALAFIFVSTASAQSGIAGVVQDTTNGVLPGVTVEASSPALIEKVRSVVTDGQGQYKIVNLRPGLYVVTFSLPGFNTVRREGIELPAAFTASVNAVMRVGALEETITVSGDSPIVDLQNVVQQRTIKSDLIDAVPTGRTFQSIAALVPGMSGTAVTRPSAQDVGGLGGEGGGLIIHGSRSADGAILLDGLPWNSMSGTWSSSIRPNTGEAQEIVYDLGAVSAESATGGVRMNIVPKEGGNAFTGMLFGNFANGGMQTKNLSQDLIDRGLQAGNKMDKIWDLNGAFGGPIKKDKVWMFGSVRYWGLNEFVAGSWYDADPRDFVYTPDLSRQAIDSAWTRAETARLTWQITPKNKLGLYAMHEGRLVPHYGVSATRTPEASWVQRNPRQQLAQASWTSPLTNRLLFQAGALIYPFDYHFDPQPEATRDLPSITEQSTSVVYRAWTIYTNLVDLVKNYRASVSYVTGSHAFKAGFTQQSGWRKNGSQINGDMNYQFLMGVPRSVTVHTTPYWVVTDLNWSLGMFIQDQWTFKRTTLNFGVRYDYFNSSVPEQSLPATRFAQARHFDAVPDVPNWTDLSPRLGVSHDVFGTGKTAVKATLSRYVAAETVGFAGRNNPINTSVNSASRTWDDRNRDFIPQADELGPLNPSTFGQLNITTRFADDVREGFGSRGYNWETSIGVQHEVIPRLAVNATYFRRWFGNFTVTDNLAVTPEDYDPFCVTAPTDPRLPNSGEQICGLYDVTPSKGTALNNLVTFAENFGTQKEVYDGVDLTVTGRLPHGALLEGGLNSGRTALNNCFVIDSPQARRFCEVKPPFLTQVKLLGTVHVPWNIELAGTFQSIPGPEILAPRAYSRQEVFPSLQRNLVNATTSVPLVSPGTIYGQRLNQMDVRVSKNVTVGRTRFRAMVDLYNAFNVNTVLLMNNTYGPEWQRPTYILPGRLLKVGAQVNF